MMYELSVQPSWNIFFFFLGDREGTAKKGAVEAKLGGG